MAGFKLDMNTLKRWVNPRAYKDLDTFIESMPEKAGKNTLIAAGIVWAAAGMLFLLNLTEANTLANLRGQYYSESVLQPKVPKIVKKPVDSKKMIDLAEKLNDLYPNVNIQAQGNGLTIKSSSLNSYGQFREAVAHTNAINKDWSPSVRELCIGRECKAEPLKMVVVFDEVEIANVQ